ncbi:MAG: shikimate dehydrogenase [bacterium]|nr:shikimate dehydrogenase [Candidatus Sumerlaeota bacterium]
MSTNILETNAGSNIYPPAKAPTIYFIGVTTGKSSIMRVFPEWAAYLGLKDAVIKGVDFKPHDEPAGYRVIVEHIKADELSLGALVTTHKIDLLKACRDMFDVLDPHAQLTGEISCISKRFGKLIGHAKDPITSGFALDAFLPLNYWEKTGADMFVIGAGGSTTALTCHLIGKDMNGGVPGKIYISNRSLPRLQELESLHNKIPHKIEFEYHHAPRPDQNDAIMARLKPYSLVINATGLGKDAPGSPLTGNSLFPMNGIAWDFNYRGDLVFIDQAQAQQASRNLTIKDGWIYFIHGWTRVVAEVFNIDIPVKGPRFNDLSEIAKNGR